MILKDSSDGKSLPYFTLFQLLFFLSPGNGNFEDLTDLPSAQFVIMSPLWHDVYC